MTTPSRWPSSSGSPNRVIVATIENTDPRISYLPSVCNETAVSSSSKCNAPWQVVPLSGATSGTVTSTFGPTSASGNLVPQLFLVIRGTSFILTTSAVSNATANVTVLASPSDVSVTTSFDSSAGSISTVNLPPDQDVTLAVTYLLSPDGEPTRLDIDSVIVFSPDRGHTSLTSTPLPSSSSLPSFIIPAPSASITASRPKSSLSQPKGTIVGESLAGFFGIILIFISIYVLYRWSRRRRLTSAGVAEIKMRTRDKGKETAATGS
ncbi:hypothetical protein F5148DRAFT_1202914 [Russula earlei]|uniref:Uncharacterized protein n=1 Tax=Russula earlei TaxID=71964 RepID=A0ACC0U8K9_9AGAM|nr:hypothetical protein F5148DRAFT_1202914 [Russula earlei]